MFHNDEYAGLRQAEFSFRCGGLRVTFYCEKLRRPRERIRTAAALRIRGKVIPGHWDRNREGTRWTLYLDSPAPPKTVASIASHEVWWALGFRRHCDYFESYGAEGVTGWRVVGRTQECEMCGVPFEAGPREWVVTCGRCSKLVVDLAEKVVSGAMSAGEFTGLLHPQRVGEIARRDRRAGVRWVREFAAKGSFTPSQFRALCRKYGDVCLCCGGNGPLVADHVVALERGGINDITNIQPLCKRCNDMKGTGSTDYRVR